MNEINIPATVLAVSAGYEKEGKFVSYPKFTVRLFGQLVELPCVRDVVLKDTLEEYLDKQVNLVLEISVYKLTPTLRIKKLEVLG